MGALLYLYSVSCVHKYSGSSGYRITCLALHLLEYVQDHKHSSVVLKWGKKNESLLIFTLYFFFFFYFFRK